MQEFGALAPKLPIEGDATAMTTTHPIRDATPSSGENSRCESDEEYRSPTTNTTQPNVPQNTTQNSRGVSSSGGGGGGTTNSPMSISTPSTAELTSLLQRHNGAAGAEGTSTPLNATISA